MDLIALAVPFFLLAIAVEFAVDRARGTSYFRLNDAISSLSAGTLSSTFGYFTQFVQVLIWGYVLENLAIFDLDLASFDGSVRGLALWGLAFVGWDFCYYWAHRLGHEVSILWAAHAVHHQSEDYNLSTALRQTSTGFLFGWIFYLPLFLLGFPALVLATVSALNLIYQFWVHTQHVRKLGWLDRVMVTPSNHRVHHAQNQRYIDRNYGGVFILWDRMFGSFQEELDEEPVVFGVRKPLANWNPFWANVQVYAYLWFDAVRTKHWKDKIGIWFRRTGWRPEDMEAQYPRRPASLVEFRKFDPEVSSSIRRYTLGQFLLMIVGVLLTGWIYSAHGAAAALVPCLLLWSTLYGLGVLLEGRSYALKFERVRLLLIVPLCMIVITVGGQLVIQPELLWIVTGIYMAGSLAGLKFVRYR